MDLVTARRRSRQPRGSRVSDGDSYALTGGLNVEDSPLLVRPGELLECKNYEPKSGSGYERVRGYERYDGRTLPSKAPFYVLKYERATSVPAIGASRLLGQQSGCQGDVIDLTQTQLVTTINLAKHSKALNDSSVWTRLNVTVGDSGIVNPIDGAPDAVWLAETTSNTEHSVVQAVAKAASTITYWWSVYVRPHGGTNGCALRANFSISKAEVKFDFSSGSASAVESNGDFIGREEFMEQLAGGWWRIGVKFQSSVQASVSCMVMSAAPGGILIYPGDPTRGLELVGAQLEVATADSVAPTPHVTTDAFIRGNGTGQVVLISAFTAGGLGGTGNFIDGERLQTQFPTTDWSQADGVQQENIADTDELDAQYHAKALARQRLNTQQVAGGAGEVIGTAIYKGVGYALIDNGAGACLLMKATTSGFVPVQNYRKLKFDAGQAAGIKEGDTVTGGTTASTGVVRRVVILSGTFATNDAVGYLIVTNLGFTFQNNEQLLVGGTLRATADGTADIQTLLVGGTFFRSRVHNFFGHASTERLYFVDGANKCIEFQDSPEFVNHIDTGMTDDKPKHIAVHGNQLWLGFSGGSLQRSSVGEPATFVVTLGATELALGTEITGLLEEIGKTLFVFGRNKTMYVAGTVADYVLEDFAIESGAFNGSVQRIGMGLYLDDRGFTTLSATQKFGNYAANSVSAKAQKRIDEIRSTATVTASCIVKNKNVYRCFFSDGRFVSIGVEGSKITGVTTGDLGKVVRCIASGEDLLGNEFILFSSDDGYLYRMESGTSFDSGKIEAFLRTAFHFSGTPQRRKRYRRALFQIRASGKCTMKIGADYSFANPDEAGETVKSVNLDGGGGLWNVSKWNEFKWSAGMVSDASIKLDASGTNIGFLIAHESDTEDGHSIDSVVLSQSLRRPERGARHG